MNIYIIGPMGAGKTVFSYMLNDYIEQHPKNRITFKASDWNTKSHLAAIGQTLKNHQWPLGTRKLTLLQWDWQWIRGFGTRQAKFTLIDPPGEDIESELRGDSTNLRILENIRSADVLFILLDLHEHQCESAIKRTQNAWIAENVLKNANSRQRIVLGVLKGDLMIHLLPVPAWPDKTSVLDLIGKMMPEFNLAAFKIQLEASKVQALVFSAIFHTEARRDDDDILERVPSLPLRSEGLDLFVTAITKGHSDNRGRENWRKYKECMCKLLISKFFRVVVAAFVVLYFTYWYYKSNF